MRKFTRNGIIAEPLATSKKVKMKKKILFFLVTLSISIVFSQNSDERILFVVDSVPVIKEPEKGFGTLSEEVIDRVDVLSDKKTIELSGYKGVDKIMYIFTKAYVQRPDSIKAIPTTNLMTKKSGTWYLKNSPNPYSGPFRDYYLNGKLQGEGILHNGRLKGKRRMYHLNGNISDEIQYENGFSNGLEKRYYEDGTLKQEGIIKNEKKIGDWKAYHPNGQLKNITPFQTNGKINGKSITYYSTGKVKSSYEYEDGTYVKNKTFEKFYKLYNEGQEYFRTGYFKSAIKKYSKCIELDPTSADSYFARGTARLNEFEYDGAIEDFDKTIEIEPYFTNAYANRAFVTIRKYEFANSRDIKGFEGVKIMSSKKAEIPWEEKEMVCADLNKAVSLGDDSPMVLEALKTHCKK